MTSSAPNSRIDSVVENARSSTVTEERLTQGYLKHDIRIDPGPLTVYIGHVEQPHFIFYNKKSGITLADERGTEEVEPAYSKWAFLVVTDRGLHFVLTVGQAVEIDLPMEEIRSIDAEFGWGSKEIMVSGPDAAYRFPVNPSFGKSEVKDAVSYVSEQASDTTEWQGWESEVERVRNSPRVGSDMPSGTVTGAAEPVLSGSDEPLAVAESTVGGTFEVYEEYVVVGQPGSPIAEPSNKRFAVKDLQRVEIEKPSRLGGGWVFVKEKNGLVFDSEQERLASPNAVTFDRYSAEEFREAAEVLTGLIEGKGRRAKSESGDDGGGNSRTDRRASAEGDNSETERTDSSHAEQTTDSDTGGTDDSDDEPATDRQDPKEILRQRFAEGEIDADEYQKQLDVLEETS